MDPKTLKFSTIELETQLRESRFKSLRSHWMLFALCLPLGKVAAWPCSSSTLLAFTAAVLLLPVSILLACNVINSEQVTRALCRNQFYRLWVFQPIVASVYCFLSTSSAEKVDSVFHIPAFIIYMQLHIVLMHFLVVPFHLRTFTSTFSIVAVVSSRIFAPWGLAVELLCYASVFVSEVVGWTMEKQIRIQFVQNANHGALLDVLANLSEPVVVMKGHIIKSVNDAVCETFGYSSPDELIGQNVSILMTSEDSSRHHEYVEAYETTGKAKVIGSPRAIKGQHKEGHVIPITLSVSRSTCPGEYIGILYRRTDSEARAKAEAELLALQLDHVKLQIQQGNLSSTVSIHRSARVVSAWTGAWSEASKSSSGSMSPQVTLCCIAAYFDRDGSFTGRMMMEGEIGQKLSIAPGAHAFVKVNNESFLRLTLQGTDFGEASGHTLLASEQPVLYAGEVEIDESSKLVRWNNLSGTYLADDTMCYQTELPLDLFWAVQPELTDAMDTARVHITSEGTVLYRVLECSDELFHASLQQWNMFIAEFRESNPQAHDSYERFQKLSFERTAAVSKYGYFSSLR